MKTYPIQGTEITLGDGVVRHLRYPIRVVREIKLKYGQTATDIFAHPTDTFLPDVIWQGLVEKDGLTEESLLSLIDGEAQDYVSMCFAQAFFGLRARTMFESALANQDKIMEILSKKLETPTSEPGVSQFPVTDSASTQTNSGT